MKIPVHWLLAAAFAASAAAQQLIIPPNPRVNDGRNTGTTGGATVDPQRPTLVRHITWLVLSDARQWTSADGRPLTGKLIAFEDLMTEAPQGVQPEPPQPPEHPTVVRDGKVRLQVDGKAFVVPLERLSESDRAHIEEIRKRHAKREAE